MALPARVDGGVVLVADARPARLVRRPGLPSALAQALAASAAAGPESSAGLADALASGRDQRLTAALLALDARLILVAASGETPQPLDDRLTTDGRVLPRPGERLIGVAVRAPQGRSAYAEAPGGGGPGLAAVLHVERARAPRILNAALVWWGLAPAPFRGPQLAAVLRGRRPEAALFDLAAQTARSEATPAGAGGELLSERLDAAAALCRQLVASLVAPR